MTRSRWFDLKGRGKQKAAHNMTTVTIKGTASFPQAFCRTCGLVALRNPATEAALRASCDAKADE
jgi:hypothetical protein